MTVAELLGAYLQWGAAQGLWGEVAHAQRKQTYGLLCEVLGAHDVTCLKAFHLSDWIEAQPGWKRSGTKRSRANQVNAAFNWAVRQGRLERNPFREVKYPPGPPRPCLGDDDLQLLLDHAHQRFAEALRFLRLTGCRLSELCRTTWKDVDLGKGLVILVHHKAWKKTGRVRSFVLVAEAVRLLEQIHRRQKIVYGDAYQGVVFENSQQRPWTKNCLVGAYDRVAERVGLKTEASLHGIRHAFVTRAIENGAPVKMISVQIGHSSTRVTEAVYCHVTAERNHEAVRKAVELAQ